MRTVPAAWDGFQFRVDARYGFVMELTDGTTTWYFGTQEMELGANQHMYGLMTKLEGIKEGSNPIDRSWFIGDVTVSISNSPYRKDDNGDWIRPSDDLTGLIGRAATIYEFCGEQINSFPADFMERAQGVIREEISYNDNECTIRFEHNHSWEETMLPQQKISDMFSDYVREAADKYIPLLYGNHLFQDEATAICVPLAVCVFVNQTDPDDPGQFAVASHNVKWDIAAPYYQEPNVVEPSKCVSFTNDSDTKTYFSINGITLEIAWLPDSSNWSGWGFSSQDKAINWYNAHDADDQTYAAVRDNVQDDGTDIIGEMRVGFSENESISSLFNSFYGLALRYKVNPITTVSAAEVRVYWSRDGAAENDYKSWTPTYNNIWQTTSYNDTIALVNECLVAARMQSNGLGDIILNNHWMFSLYDMQLLSKYDQTALREAPDIFASCGGRVYGSWIDESNRNNTQIEGSEIIDPAFIIESLFRDEFGLTDSDIDTDSFDSVEDISFSVVLNLHNDNRSKGRAIIKQLCEQSLFMFAYGSDGRVRLIKTNQPDDSTLTVSRTIPFSHILDGKITVEAANQVINRLHTESRYWPQLDEYRDKNTYNDSTLQSLFISEETVQWPNLVTPANVQTVAEHYVKAGTGLWSVPHNLIIFETPGIMYSDIEVGDWIEVDSTSVDPQIKGRGASWSGTKHIVIEITQTLDRTRITAMENWL